MKVSKTKLSDMKASNVKPDRLLLTDFIDKPMIILNS